MKHLLTEGIVKIFIGFLILCTLIFLPAGTLNYVNGYLFLSVLFVPMLIAGTIMLIKSPNLLKERLNGKENDPKQQLVVKLSGLMFLSGFIASGLSYRFSFLLVPFGISATFSVVFLFGYVLYFKVLHQNAYLTRTIKTQENQSVITTGLYGIVRHPMYTATIIMFLSMPLILGSLLSLFIFLMYPFLIVVRILNEEKFLEKELNGYTDYKKRVRYRLIPYIW